MRNIIQLTAAAPGWWIRHIERDEHGARRAGWWEEVAAWAVMQEEDGSLDVYPMRGDMGGLSAPSPSGEDNEEWDIFSPTEYAEVKHKEWLKGT